MKNFKIKSLVLFAIVASFGLKASCPPLPNFTTVELTGIPSSVQDDYRIRVEISGIPSYTDNIYVYGPFNSSEPFSADHLFTDNDDYHVLVRVWTQLTSGGSWTYHGSATSAVGTNRHYIGDGLYFFNLSWSSLSAPE